MSLWLRKNQNLLTDIAPTDTITEFSAVLLNHVSECRAKRKVQSTMSIISVSRKNEADCWKPHVVFPISWSKDLELLQNWGGDRKERMDRIAIWRQIIDTLVFYSAGQDTRRYLIIFPAVYIQLTLFSLYPFFSASLTLIPSDGMFLSNWQWWKNIKLFYSSPSPPLTSYLPPVTHTPILKVHFSLHLFFFFDLGLNRS